MNIIINHIVLPILSHAQLTWINKSKMDELYAPIISKLLRLNWNYTGSSFNPIW